MPEGIVLDPTSELASNAQFDLMAGGFTVMDVDWDDPDPDLLFAGSADTEGDRLVSSRPTTRQPQMTVKVTAATAAALDTATAQLQQKIAKLARESGTLKRTTVGGNVGTLDLIYARCAPKDDWNYVNALTAIVPLRFSAYPYWRGPEVTTVLDDFSTDSVGAGSWTFDAGAGTVAVAGGVLTITSTALKRLVRSAWGSFYDSQATFKFTTGTVADGTMSYGLVAKRVDANNYIRARVSGTTGLIIQAVVGGVAATVAGAVSGVITALAVSTAYWLRFRIEGNLCTAEFWTTDPALGGSAATTITGTLAAANAAALGQGISGTTGLYIDPADTGGNTETFDSLQVDPYLYRETTNPLLVTPPIYGIKGDVAALGRQIVTDLQGNDQWWASWGNESRYFSPGVPTLLDQFGADTIGSGAWAFDAGSGTISVSAGQLVPSTTAVKQMYRADTSAYTDARLTVKFTTGASVAAHATALFLRLDANNYITGRCDNLNRIALNKFEGGALAAAYGTAAFTFATATTYWLRFAKQGNVLTVEVFTADPETGAAAGQTLSFTLTGADAVKFGAGVLTTAGMSLTPQAVDWRYDDFRVQPLQGCTEPRIKSESLLVAGYSGVYTTRAGATTDGTVANHVVRHTLATQYAASCAIPPRGNVGSYRVFARFYRPTTNAGAVSVALEWGTGDLLRVTRNTPVTFAVGERQGDFTVTDLGRIQIPPATKGSQQWQARIIAKSSVLNDVLDIDYIWLEPYAEGSGEASGVASFSTPGNLTAHDEFDQTAGNLNAKVLPAGGTWATSGSDATDITVEIAGHTATRATTSDVSGKFAIAGSTVFADCVASMDFKWTAIPAGTGLNQRMVLRYTDVNNYFMFTTLSVAGKLYLQANKVIASVASGWQQIDLTSLVTAGQWYTLRGMVFASGRFMVALFPQGSSPTSWLFSSSDAALATGGTLASGKVGLYDANGSVTAITRNYDNFWAAVAVPDAAIFANRQAELRYDSAVRQDTNGVFWTPESSYQGDFCKLLPAGRENRQNRIVLDTCRNDPKTMFDPSPSKLQLQIAYTPRYLHLPAL